MFLFLDDCQRLSTEMRCFAETAAHFDDREVRLLCGCPYKLNDIFIKNQIKLKNFLNVKYQYSPWQ
jgi:hypothetical protein